MSVVEEPKRAGLVARVQGILLHPRAEWDIIDTEPATTQGLFTGYACILAAIPPVALIVSHLLFIHWTIVPIVPIVVIAVVSYVASLIGVFIVGFIIDALAPSFDGRRLFRGHSDRGHCRQHDHRLDHFPDDRLAGGRRGAGRRGGLQLAARLGARASRPRLPFFAPTRAGRPRSGPRLNLPLSAST